MNKHNKTEPDSQNKPVVATQELGGGMSQTREIKRYKTWQGTYVYLRLIHVDIWQKPTKFCKAIILQLKTKKILKTTSITLQAYQNVVPKRERKDLR